ncbi:hypothetical protein [Noviherbaspirillum sp.]|uniref:hypothetical protein n=1 Tax=Noviherbaspirillum sp. TaxID=1926288 RepID=UPI002B48B189|nr:hypothetical protein [Noviherbaspirillum sp.]HJV81434.1 hypothetical protein [Noviherbaspirillum sp.]
MSLMPKSWLNNARYTSRLDDARWTFTEIQHLVANYLFAMIMAWRVDDEEQFVKDKVAINHESKQLVVVGDFLTQTSRKVPFLT